MSYPEFMDPHIEAVDTLAAETSYDDVFSIEDELNLTADSDEDYPIEEGEPEAYELEGYSDIAEVEVEDIRLPLAPVEVTPARQAISELDRLWHGLRGYDFAGLESILKDGLRPAENQGHYAVCLSVPPDVARLARAEPSSFYLYTLSDGLSVSVATPDIMSPRCHAGFQDEVRKPFVNAADINGVMLPEASATTPLTHIQTRHEPRMPAQLIAYTERTMQHLADLGANVSDDLRAQAASAIRDGQEGKRSTREQTTVFEQTAMAAYAGYIQTHYDVPVPTVGHMVSIVLDRARGDSPLKVFAYEPVVRTEAASLMVKMATLYPRSNDEYQYENEDEYEDYRYAEPEMNHGYSGTEALQEY